MVYTLTLNPSLDHIVKLDEVKVGETNRSYEDTFYPGGKGINVSRVLTSLGVPNKAYAFMAGFVGEEIRNLLESQGVDTEFIKISDGNNRINIKLKADIETEINGKGPDIKTFEKVKLLERLYDIGEGDYLILAGSIPESLGNTFYMDIMEMLKDSKANIIVDTTGESLLNALKYKPMLIKPNKRELEELAGYELNTEEDIIKEAQKLHEKGAKNILVSLGKIGAVLLTDDGKVYKRKAPEGKLVNSVGSGDSMVAGFIYAMVNELPMDEVISYAVAAGSATAFNEDLATKKDIEEVLKSL